MHDEVLINGELESALRTAHYEVIKGRRRSIRLPSACHFSGSPENLQLALSADVVASNMQNNASAFEGWLLALKSWGAMDRAQLAWTKPKEVRSGHYQRFLYRVLWFRELFPWFGVVDECLPLLEESRVLKGVPGELLLKTANGIPKARPEAAAAEAHLEKFLLETGWLVQNFGIHQDKVGRQFPVGLFEGKVSNENRVFTGGKSAIDLVGLNEESKCLWIFELKTEDNKRMGGVSELLFYVYVVHDLLHGKFRFGDNAGPKAGRLRQEVLNSNNIEALCGCFLSPDFHPLLDGNKVTDLLNQAAWPGKEKISFCLGRLPKKLIEELPKAERTS